VELGPKETLGNSRASQRLLQCEDSARLATPPRHGWLLQQLVLTTSWRVPRRQGPSPDWSAYGLEMWHCGPLSDLRNANGTTILGRFSCRAARALDDARSPHLQLEPAPLRAIASTGYSRTLERLGLAWRRLFLPAATKAGLRPRRSCITRSMNSTITLPPCGRWRACELSPAVRQTWSGLWKIFNVEVEWAVVLVHSLCDKNAAALLSFYNRLSSTSIRTFRPLGLKTSLEVCQRIATEIFLLWTPVLTAPNDGTRS
jgi:hypothetical protein